MYMYDIAADKEHLLYTLLVQICPFFHAIPVTWPRSSCTLLTES